MEASDDLKLKPFPDEDIAIKQKLAVHCEIEKCDECRWVATITADRKRIGMLKSECDARDKTIADQTAVIERLRDRLLVIDRFAREPSYECDMCLKISIEARQALDIGKEEKDGS